ncbi:MAG: hypothetical protein K0S11_946 [Gammaproteobacteria bacterium]|jgi:IS30 family transposase|nr:hypothetical protein [Gammaproteobacteria bacterium]
MKRKQIKFNQEVEKFIREKLLQDWSPEQISGYAKRHGLFSISHERIYQFVLGDKQKGGKLYKQLRHQHKKYRKRYGSPTRQSPLRNRVMIDKRPVIVDEKKRLGDWEIESQPKSLNALPETSDLLELPEVQEQIKTMAKAHWENWLDESIPALDNQTPREAAKTKDGREKLEALLLHYERHDVEKANNLFKTDIADLRAKLSLDKHQ